MTEPLTYNIPEASARLGSIFTPDWLKNHLAELPHIKTGAGTGRAGRIAFSEQDLRDIVAMYRVAPAPTERPSEFKSVRSRRRAVFL